ncbi:DUF302 domain-containing protein [Copranaerobaculum intestinale]|nr:DUF302 domain-containing protein [Copranaerobaculum intestinale]
MNKSTYCQVKSGDSFEMTRNRLKTEIMKRDITIFAEFDHHQNALEAGLDLPKSTVLVFGSPQAGTQLMLENPAIALELPLRIAVWEDREKAVWIGYNDPIKAAEPYGLSNHSVTIAMQKSLADIVHHAVNTKEVNTMLEEGTEVYFLVSGYVLKGKVIDLHKTKDSYTFSIEGYGGCGGNHILSGDQLHRRIFLSEAEAQQYKDIEQMYLEGHC